MSLLPWFLLLTACPFRGEPGFDVFFDTGFRGDEVTARWVHPTAGATVLRGDHLAVWVAQDPGHTVTFEMSSGDVTRRAKAEAGITVNGETIWWLDTPDLPAGPASLGSKTDDAFHGTIQFRLTDPPSPGPLADGAWWIPGSDSLDPGTVLLTRVLDLSTPGGRALTLRRYGSTWTVGAALRAVGLPADPDTTTATSTATPQDPNHEVFAISITVGTTPPTTLQGILNVAGEPTGVRATFDGQIQLSDWDYDKVRVVCDLARELGRLCEPCEAGTCITVKASNLAGAIWR